MQTNTQESMAFMYDTCGVKDLEIRFITIFRNNLQHLRFQNYRKKRTTIICNISHLTELNIDVNVRRVVTQRTILPGTISLGTRNDNHATNTKIILGI